MSSAASLERAGRQTKHPIVCLNGGGEGDPHVLVQYIEPGTIIAWGTDDDMISMVIANYPSRMQTRFNGVHDARTLVLFGCFCGEDTDFLGRPTGKRPYEEGRLFVQEFALTESVAVLLEPGMY